VPIIRATATSLSHFVNIVSRYADRWEGPWFRGQDHASYPLTPRRYRYRSIDEDEIRSEFKRRAPQLLLGTQPQSEWERYFLMQHYGMPTRLVDWSEGGLLALHFAVISNRARNDAAVWALDPFWLNGEVAGRLNLPSDDVRRLSELLPEADDVRDTELLNEYLPHAFPQRRHRLPEFPIAVQPPHIDRRIAAQLSSFTIHGRDPMGLENVAQSCRSPRLAKVTIPAGSIRRMREQLLDAGITEATVYPDLYGLALELTRLHATRPVSRLTQAPTIRRFPPRGIA
jgi:hypothetical protein